MVVEVVVGVKKALDGMRRKHPQNKAATLRKEGATMVVVQAKWCAGGSLWKTLGMEIDKLSAMLNGSWL